MRDARDPLLLLLVFCSGATVMSTEMGATRLLAPYFGTSLLIWAALIGLVLLYLTIGYTLGGRLADRFPTHRALYKVTAWAGFSIVLVPILSQPVLELSARGFAEISRSIFLSSLFSILLLFAVPLTLLGTVSPWAIRLRVRDVAHAGNAAGSLYALSTVGSLLGTFIPVLFLQPRIGTRASIWVFGIALLGLSLAGLLRHVEHRRAVLPYAAMLALAVALVVLFQGGRIRAAEGGDKLIYEDESAYNYIQVTEDEAGTKQLILNEGQATHSVYNEQSLLTGGPWDYFLLAPLFRPQGLEKPVEDVLLIGLAAGTISNQYAQVYPRARMDGVEIDGQIVDVGRKYFSMNKPQLQAHVEDGRSFLVRSKTKYDVIGIDAYRQPYIPFHLATQEFFAQVSEKLQPDGVVIINTGRTPGDYRLTEALGTTMRSVFPSVFVIDTDRYLNSLVYASKTPMTLEQFKRNAAKADDPYLQAVVGLAFASGDVCALEECERLPNSGMAAFTDDLAPIERVIDQIILDYVREPGEEESASSR